MKIDFCPVFKVSSTVYLQEAVVLEGVHALVYHLHLQFCLPHMQLLYQSLKYWSTYIYSLTFPFWCSWNSVHIVKSKCFILFSGYLKVSSFISSHLIQFPCLSESTRFIFYLVLVHQVTSDRSRSLQATFCILSTSTDSNSPERSTNYLAFSSSARSHWHLNFILSLWTSDSSREISCTCLESD